MSNIPRITETEWSLMQVVWRKGPSPSQKIIEDLQAIDPNWHPKTARTLLGRLVAKKVLELRKNTRPYVYRALVAESECKRVETASFVERVFGGSLKPMLAHAIESRKLSREEIQELKSMLEQTEEE